MESSPSHQAYGNVDLAPLFDQPSYAVIFRTHFWDAFVDRQFKRLQKRVCNGTVFVLVDETRGHVAGIPTENVLRLTDDEVLDNGYIAAGEGSIQWFSGDAPLYLFRKSYPNYAYYVQLEYDVNLHLSVDHLVERVSADKVDVVSLERRPTNEDWYWMDSIRGVYSTVEPAHHLICFSIYSRNALDKLSSARLAYAERFREGSLRAWPFCEAFIPMEGKLQGLKIAQLSTYGDVGSYDWWPPYPENGLHDLKEHDFVHPVLDQSRFIASMFKFPNTRSLLLPFSDFHKRLRWLGAKDYVSVVTSKSFAKLVSKTLYRRVKRVFRAAR